jgi:hypothetical protein
VTQYKTSEQREIGARVSVEGLEEGRNSRNNVSEAKPMIGKGKRSETNNSSAQHRCGVAKISSRPMWKEMVCASMIPSAIYMRSHSIPFLHSAHAVSVLAFEGTA